MRYRGFAVALTLTLAVIALIGCSPRIPAVPPITLEIEATEELCIDEETGAELSYQDALAIAQDSMCVEEGTLLDDHDCNAASGTWWIDLAADQPNCNPACVVDANSQTAEINWRCTGLVTPEETEAATATLSPEPTATTAPSPTPTLEPLADWPRYRNETYGFGFKYPPEWQIELLTLEDGEEGSINAVQLTKDTLWIRVEFKSPEEEIVVGPGTLPEGQVIERGTAILLDREIPKHVLVHEEKDKVVFVGERFAGLELYIEMRDDPEGDYASAEIPAAAHETFEQILGSFERLGAATTADAYPGWLTYTDPHAAPTMGLSFRYPSEWDLTQVEPEGDVPTATTVELRKNGYLLHVQYKSTEAEVTLGPSSSPEGVTSEAGTTVFMGQPTARYVVVADGELKMVFINASDETLAFYVALTQDPEQVAYEDVHIPEALRTEMDLILASFQGLTR